MKRKQITLVGICGLLFVAAIWIPRANAQVQGNWSEPYRLSSDQGKASHASSVADQYGYVHVFWSETLFEDQSSIIQYARFDGQIWTTPFDIHMTAPFVSVQNISSFIDPYGTLHLAWSQGDGGPVYYSHAPAAHALSARQWEQPARINFPAKHIKLLVDSQGVLHMLYNKIVGQALGVYYSRSRDQGITWSDPVWLDPDILRNHTPTSLTFELDDGDGLHAVWFYAGFDGGGDWVRYAHSLDGGDTWSLPFTIDKYVEGSDHELRVADPVMTIQGETVHVIWAGGPQPYRNHRISTDSGRTWSAPIRIFGNLHGQAGEGFAEDGLGRAHFVSQIRYPQGIYHSFWDKDGWTRPSLIYLISTTAFDPIGDRIHAHHVHSAIRAGNQLVVTFADPPPVTGRRLFAMHRTLDDVAPLPAVPTPVPTATPAPLPSPTPINPSPTIEGAVQGTSFDVMATQSPAEISRPDLAIWIGLVPSLFVVGGVVIYRFLVRRRLER
jgi:hypothetical protein